VNRSLRNSTRRLYSLSVIQVLPGVRDPYDSTTRRDVRRGPESAIRSLMDFTAVTHVRCESRHRS
jgi:hypothetical protein